ELGQALEEADDLLVPGVGAAEREHLRRLPLDARVEPLQHGRNVPAAEGLVAAADQLDVVLRHGVPPVSRRCRPLFAGRRSPVQTARISTTSSGSTADTSG